jgi:DnaJ-class molecular chaperone
MRAPDAYRILQVAGDSDAATVRRAYRSLVKKFHPDLAGRRGNAARLDRVIEAYRYLSDNGYLRELAHRSGAGRISAHSVDGRPDSTAPSHEGDPTETLHPRDWALADHPGSRRVSACGPAYYR